MRLRFVAVGLAVVVPTIAVACIPDPKSDFEDYTKATETIRNQPPTEGGAQLDSAPVTESVKSLYYGACLSALAAGDLKKLLRFYTEVEYTPDGPGATSGRLLIKLTALKFGTNFNAPDAVSKAWTAGTTYTVETRTNAAGGYQATLGNVTIPGVANPISQRDIIVEMTSLPGTFGSGQFCSQLIGRVVVPTDLQLEGPSNTCLFFPVKEGDVPPDYRFEDGGTNRNPPLRGTDFPLPCELK